MKRKRSVTDLDARGKRVLVRVDFNVPLEDGQITDDTRIRAAVPTIKALQGQGAKVILTSHLGRPDGKVVEELRLAPVAKRLEELLGGPVATAPDCVGPEAQRAVEALPEGGVLLLENVRFHAAEEENDPEFAKQLAALGDLYVNDAFGAAHRAHASTTGITQYLPSAAGLLMEKELQALGGILESPKQPFVALVGGAKVSSKLGVLESMLQRVNTLVIGGGMANTFLKARGYEVGTSLLEEDLVGTARELDARAKERGVELLLPTDVVVADRVEDGATSQVVPVESVPAGMAIVDIGPQTIAQYSAALQGVGTILWNGPMGVFEIPAFSEGTRAIANALAGSGATTVIGGGESVAAVEQLGLADKMTHISTGGGASLEFLEGRELPGVAVLPDA